MNLRTLFCDIFRMCLQPISSKFCKETHQLVETERLSRGNWFMIFLIFLIFDAGFLSVKMSTESEQKFLESDNKIYRFIFSNSSFFLSKIWFWLKFQTIKINAVFYWSGVSSIIPTKYISTFHKIWKFPSSGPEDHVFVYFADHGNRNLLGFPHGVVSIHSGLWNWQTAITDFWNIACFLSIYCTHLSHLERAKKRNT